MALACGVRTSVTSDLNSSIVGVGDLAAFFFGERFLQGAALVHGGGGDDAAIVGNTFQAGQFAGGELHGNPPGMWMKMSAGKELL